MKSDEVLLSIVIPTKNRAVYLKSLIELICSFENDDIEVVVQDNSDTNESVASFLQESKYQNVVYHYDPTEMSVIQNSELAIRHSRGKYVCFMGDDDLLSEKLYDFVRWMDKNGVESAFFNRARYSWPGVTHKAHKFPSLRIPRFKGKIRNIDVDKEFDHLLKTGAVELRLVPQLYHGVVLRKCLNEVCDKTGTFFPGPSPDMAIAAALSKVVKKHVYCDLPLISAGASPKSAAGMGAQHKHTGQLKEISFLPKNTEAMWEKRIPKIWTGPTIYAESCLKALRAMGAEADVARFNYNYFYAHFSVFCKQHEQLLPPFLKGRSVSSAIRYYCSAASIFIRRCVCFLQNIFRKITCTVVSG